jgi:ferredoxin-nitrate reductase
LKKALQNAKFVVVQEISHNADTAKHADLLLPAAGWLKKKNDDQFEDEFHRINAPGEAFRMWKF